MRGRNLRCQPTIAAAASTILGMDQRVDVVCKTLNRPIAKRDIPHTRVRTPKHIVGPNARCISQWKATSSTECVVIKPGMDRLAIVMECAVLVRRCVEKFLSDQVSL